jgi:hypothetical protein
MGALTLKSLAFYLRNWDTEKSESVDPTDGFGSNTRVYINNNQIVQIEPEYNSYTFNTWLTDKGRQFFDSMFKVWSENEKNSSLPSDSWLNITKNLTQVLYIHDHCNKQNIKNSYFTIVFESVSIEVLSLLVIIAQNYSFVNLKRAENFNSNNDLESNFQLNITSNNKAKLSNSDICLLISSNPRYEGYFLNLNLRQRFFKGNFKCLSIGSLINLTFPVIFLGSNTNVLKTISTGNNLTCQSLKTSKNPITIFNNELLKRTDASSILETLKILKYSNNFSNAWNNINSFSSTLNETGVQSIGKFLPVTKQDLTDFSVLYFLNTNFSTVTNLKQITEFKLLNSKVVKNNEIKSMFLDQSWMPKQNLQLHNKSYLSKNNSVLYSSLPVSLFYENEETFINTEGLVKRTVKLIFKKKNKNNWQLLRKFFKHLKTNLNFLDSKQNQIIFFNSKEKNLFRNFIYFQYQATQSLVNLNFYLLVKTQPFSLTKNKFKTKNLKFINTKLKYWLDDFYSGGRDEYSQNSLVLTNCSKILRQQSTNFF